ncbi:MAG: NAD-dependent protein deacetylase [Gammaproteobacteria bacterium]|nr:NAD-dependent protein deacetylase [Gammaproteobacteria bacterium]NNF61699.1 NAD-dependent protein deacetylase [Gammaproteobacteria bacterium]NNM20329.1 NAD-dependent protein deacetylase [Gammaproteobacteria bacterium]
MRRVTGTSIDELVSLLSGSTSVVALTGAGCSTESGIPDYRDANGDWKQRQPVQYQDFVASRAMRQRYWARSMIGWQRVATARPNAAHFALTKLENCGTLGRIITQNIDRLHQQAGSKTVIDLHGRLDRVVCLTCSSSVSRGELQQQLISRNPGWRDIEAVAAPDGDASVEADFGNFSVVSCHSCGGVLKPDVVFFGESVPRTRVTRAMAAVEAADVLLVVGSSLMVWSGLRFVRRAAERGIPTVLVNLGRTRADELFTHRITGRCSEVLSQIAQAT